MLRILIVDDEPLARERLADLLAAEPMVEIVGQARNGQEALELCDTHRPNVLFLDIEMPGMNGFDVVRSLAEPPLIVFATAYDEYAVKAFEANAIDYLLKPIQPARVHQAVAKLQAALTRDIGAYRTSMTELLSMFARESRRVPAKIAGRKGKRIVLLGLREVLHITIDDKLVFAHTPADRFLLDKTITQMEDLLGESGFFRISRAHLVNLEHVRELVPMVAGSINVLLRNGTELEVSRDRTRELKERLAV